MRKPAGEWLLSLLAGERCASALAGDFAEETGTVGGVRYSLWLTSAVATLFCSSFRHNFPRLLGRSVAGAWLFAALVNSSLILVSILDRNHGFLSPRTSWKIFTGMSICAAFTAGRWIALGSRNQGLAASTLCILAGWLGSHGLALADHYRAQSFGTIWSLATAAALVAGAISAPRRRADGACVACDLPSGFFRSRRHVTAPPQSPGI